MKNSDYLRILSSIAKKNKFNLKWAIGVDNNPLNSKPEDIDEIKSDFFQRILVIEFKFEFNERRLLSLYDILLSKDKPNLTPAEKFIYGIWKNEITNEFLNIF